MDKDLFRFQHFTIFQGNAAMKVGTDSDLLGALTDLPTSMSLSPNPPHKGGSMVVEASPHILDIGTGTGILSLMMAQRCPEALITAIDIDEGAIQDAKVNFESSQFSHRLTLRQQSFQDFLQEQKSKPEALLFDSVICNPPYFDKSLECDTLSKTRARHSSSLPFDVLIGGSYSLLKDDGLFSVCIPVEVYNDFSSICILTGFWPRHIYKIKTIPEKAPKRYVIVYQKCNYINTEEHVCCIRNTDRTYSDWYTQLMQPYHLHV